MSPTALSPVALVHDVLAARAGGERVLLAMKSAFPDANVHTLIHDGDTTFAQLADHVVRASWLNRSAWLRANYRYALPVASLTFAATTIEAAVTICSSSGLSHHVRTSGAKIVYCHTPARWLHDRNNYLRGYPPLVHAATRTMSPLFRNLDVRAMCSADRVLANSQAVAREIASVYGIDAQVVAPCSTLELDGPTEPLTGVDPGFVLSPARPLGYKRLDVLVEVARRMPWCQFAHVGDGPHRHELIRNAPPNFTSFGAVTDAQLRWAYQNARAVALTCAEDFGLVPLEAAAHGVHTVAPHARGLLDHDQSMLSTYEFASVDALIAALGAAPGPTNARNAERLGTERFINQLQGIVQEYR